MGINFDTWLGAADAAPTAATLTPMRAAMAWRRIQAKPTVVTFRTPALVTLAAQTVRLEYNNRATLVTSEAGTAPQVDLIIFGIKGHTEQPDTVMEEGYTFVYLNDHYRINSVLETIGERQGIAVANG